MKIEMPAAQWEYLMEAQLQWDLAVAQHQEEIQK
jgi:hypothetical protein